MLKSETDTVTDRGRLYEMVAWPRTSVCSGPPIARAEKPRSFYHLLVNLMRRRASEEGLVAQDEALEGAIVGDEAHERPQQRHLVEI